MHHRRVLVADDNQSLLDLMADMLRTSGYKVAVASSGVGVLRQVVPFSPDVMLLDMEMPVDGCQVCQRLKAHPVTCEVPVILIGESREEQNRAFAAGADDFLTKPFDLDRLMDRIHALVEQHESVLELKKAS